MRYKQLVSKKLDELNNIMLGLNSLLSQNPTREQLQNQIEKHKSKVEEIQTLVNSEQEG
jgi:exo-beta-1,3-glucanase (GH17 family)